MNEVISHTAISLHDEMVMSPWLQIVRNSDLGCMTDVEAIQLWLFSYIKSKNTFSSNRKEIVRLALWATKIKSKSISQLSTSDMLEYRTFLENPQPAEEWISHANLPFGHKDWRPFTGKPGQPPLSPVSVRQALVVLYGCFNWLQMARHIDVNPLFLTRRTWDTGRIENGSVAAKMAAEDNSRWLTPDEWKIVGKAISTLPRGTDHEKWEYHRVRWTLSALYLSKTRISELAGCTMGSFSSRLEDGKERWYLTVLGKGGKLRSVTVSEDLLEELKVYRASCGLPAMPSFKEETSIVVRFIKRDEEKISRSLLAKIVRQSLGVVSRYCLANGMDSLASKMERVTAHWLRHSGASHLLSEGVDVAMVRDELGHANISTTNTYLHTEDKKRHDVISSAQKLGWVDK